MIAFDAVSSSGNSAGNKSWSHNNGASTNGLIVWLFFDGSSGGNPISTTSVTYNGVSLTQVIAVLNGGVPIWTLGYYLPSAAAGNNTIAVTVGGSNTWSGNGVSYSGTNLTTYPSITNSGTNTGSLTMTATVANSWPTMGGTYFTTIGAGSGTVIRSTGGTPVGYTTATFDSNGPTSGSYTLNANLSMFCAASMMLEPVAAAGPANVKTFDGVTQSTGIKTYFGVPVGSTKSFNGIT